MKIVFCNNNISGFYLFRKDIVKHLWKEGHKILLLYPEITEIPEYKDALKVFCRCIPIKMFPNQSAIIDDYALYKEIKNIYKKEKPDIVFNYTIKPNIYSALAAHRLGIKVVSMMAGLGYAFCGNSIKKKLIRKFYRIGLRAADRVIVLNMHSYKTIVGKYVNKDKLILFPGGEGVNMDEYPFQDNRFEEIHFLMIARLLYDKGYQEFVEAAKVVKQQYPNVHFELLGGLSEDSPTGVSKEKLTEDIEAGIIEYLGVTNDVPKAVLRDGVVVVVASYYMEGMNRALMEACSMGRPIITTDMPGCKEMVEDGINGYCVPPKNANALADACIKFLSLEDENKRKMAHASYEKCRSQFDVKNVISNYKTIIKGLLSKKCFSSAPYDELQNLNTEL